MRSIVDLPDQSVSVQPGGVTLTEKDPAALAGVAPPVIIMIAAATAASEMRAVLDRFRRLSSMALMTLP